MSQDESFGRWLRHQRTQVHGWTQVELAHAVFCSETMIRKIERGERQPARDLAERLARAMGVPEPAVAGYIAWARGLAGRPAADQDPPGLQRNGSGYTL
jgi:transcriptional regulator with XRE-family HTH domain